MLKFCYYSCLFEKKIFENENKNSMIQRQCKIKNHLQLLGMLYRPQKTLHDLSRPAFQGEYQPYFLCINISCSSFYKKLIAIITDIIVIGKEITALREKFWLIICCFFCIAPLLQYFCISNFYFVKYSHIFKQILGCGSIEFNTFIRSRITKNIFTN